MTRRAGRLALEAAVSRRGLGPAAGVDEAGRGCCAGPLVVAACVLGDRLHPELADLDDSKKLSPATRERLHDAVMRRAVAMSVVVIDPERIDARGIHRCNLEGMRRAVAGLDPSPGFVFTDGFAVDGLGCQSTAVIGGDAVVASIAAASVLAKVTRDRIMVDLDSRYPGYGFASHKGYGTARHARAIEELGPSDIHRMSYANVRRAAQAHSRSTR
ncbi:ribonuclease HII [uncultured Dietzia sp.]|uniref:ribonuclease HII n=1 Tax=uncultured Dietzia sp. TaxID=395519 RepID=UPI0025F83AD1|nr:ribonuclease HII [uncultured Dietzia sp.]